MLMATALHLYETALNSVNDALNTYVSDVATNIVGAITPVATTLVTIYVVLWGISMLMGKISEPVMDGFGRIARLSVILGIALNVGRYNAYLSDMLWNSPDVLAGYIAAGFSDGTTNIQFLDNLLSQIFDMGTAFWQAGTMDAIPDVGMVIIAILIYLAGLILTGYAAFLLILSKMALAIILGIGPLFIMMVMFEPTKKLFDSWIGQALSFVFLVVLTSAAIKLILTIIQKYMLDVSGLVAADVGVIQAMPVIGLCGIGVLVMMQLSAIASALGGGVAISTLGAVGWTYGKATGGASAMRPTNLRRSYNKAAADVRIAAGAARATAGLPASVYRKLTGSSVNRISK